jgi:hypothetical protein
MEILPPTVEALVAQLDKDVPVPRWTPGKSFERHVYESGARSIVDLLTRLLDEGAQEI